VNNQTLISLSVSDFLQSVLDLKITATLDKIAYISFITNDHDLKLLRILMHDIDSLIKKERKSLELFYSKDPSTDIPSGLTPVMLWKYQDEQYRKSLIEPQPNKKSQVEISNLIKEDIEPLFELRTQVEAIINELEIVPNVILDDKRDMILEILKPLSGIWGNERILGPNDFEELITLTTYLINNKELPTLTLKVKKTKISNNFILFTFFRLYRSLYPGNNRLLRELWLNMIKQIFNQLSNHEDGTLYRIFSTKPVTYEQDLRSIDF
jgi:hypothetical protein